MAPVSISVPVEIERPPEPLIMPEKFPAADVSVRFFEPRETVPDPESVVTEAPEVAAEISNTPSLIRAEDVAMLPAADRENLTPALMAVEPV